ncbi:hypothetical protein [Erythrobacter sp. Alg231-14]|uniref:hypothetical protein n=1 Tax=Erythrobacter sp. Alg231-14 TaxID=1922225 RepID=UPI00307B5B13
MSMTQDQQKRLIAAMLRPFNQAALDAPIPAGRTMREELELLAFDSIYSQTAVDSVGRLQMDMMQEIKQELILMGYEFGNSLGDTGTAH